MAARRTSNDFSSAFSALYVDLIAACQAQALPEAGEAPAIPQQASRQPNPLQFKHEMEWVEASEEDSLQGMIPAGKTLQEAQLKKRMEQDVRDMKATFGQF